MSCLLLHQESIVESRDVNDLIDQTQRTERLRQYDFIETALIVAGPTNFDGLFSPSLIDKWRG